MCDPSPNRMGHAVPTDLSFSGDFPVRFHNTDCPSPEFRCLRVIGCFPPFGVRSTGVIVVKTVVASVVPFTEGFGD
jgi:hypothetical protein